MAIRKDRFGDLTLNASVVAPVATPGVAPAQPFAVNFRLNPTAEPARARLTSLTRLSPALLENISRQMPGVGGGVALENQTPVKTAIMPATPDLTKAFKVAVGVSDFVPPVKTAQEQTPPSNFNEPLTIQQQGPLPKEELPTFIAPTPKQEQVFVPNSSVCPPGYARDGSGQCRQIPTQKPTPVWVEKKLPNVNLTINTSNPLPEDMSAMPDAKEVNPNVAVLAKPPSALPLVGGGAAGGFLVGGPIGAAVGAAIGFFLHKPPAATMAPERAALPDRQTVGAPIPTGLDTQQPGVSAETLAGFGRLAAKRARRNAR